MHRELRDIIEPLNRLRQAYAKNETLIEQMREAGLDASAHDDIQATDLAIIRATEQYLLHSLAPLAASNS